MPNRDVHIPVSQTTGVIIAGLFSIDQSTEVVISRMIGGAFGGYLGGLMPDKIDPSSNGPNHRSIGHGIIPIGGALLFGSKSINSARKWLKDKADSSRHEGNLLNSLLYEFVIGVIDGFISGYLAHLALDSRTPKGLPFIL